MTAAPSDESVTTLEIGGPGKSVYTKPGLKIYESRVISWRPRIYEKSTHIRNKDTRVTKIIRAREGDRRVRCVRTTAPNADLGAGRIELRSAGLVAEVQCQDLVPDQIVSRREVLGQRHVIRKTDV